MPGLQPLRGERGALGETVDDLAEAGLLNQGLVKRVKIGM